MHTLVSRLVVLIPTLACSWLLGAAGMAPMPRLLGSLGFGMMLIWAVSIWQRRRPGLRPALSDKSSRA